MTYLHCTVLADAYSIGLGQGLSREKEVAWTNGGIETSLNHEKLWR